MGNFDGKVAFITGGARGQGRSHALHLARAGADIVICDALGAQPTAPVHMASEDDLKETVRLIEAEGRKILTRQVDVRDLAGLTQFADDAVAEFGKIDIALANAGIMSFGPLDEMSATVWQDTIDTNLTGVFNTFRAVVPHMKKAGYGRIVATSSGGGRLGFPNLSHYVAAKWGVIGLVKSLALEVCKDGITVNAVTPTNVNTDMIRNKPTVELFMPGVENPTQEQIEEAFVINPMGIPWLEPSDVSKLIMFLVSDDAKYITGETMGPLAGQAANNAV
jgi:SDR family mycofactocin-dependent oxidoreductase